MSIARSSAAGSSTTCLNEAFAQLAIKKSSLGFVRHASHNQQGAVNKAKDGPGKRLGAKKAGGEHSHLPLYCSGADNGCKQSST